MKGCVHSRLDILASLQLVYRMHLQKGKNKKKKNQKKSKERKAKSKKDFSSWEKKNESCRTVAKLAEIKTSLKLHSNLLEQWEVLRLSSTKSLSVERHRTITIISETVRAKLCSGTQKLKSFIPPFPKLHSQWGCIWYHFSLGKLTYFSSKLDVILLCSALFPNLSSQYLISLSSLVLRYSWKNSFEHEIGCKEKHWISLWSCVMYRNHKTCIKRKGKTRGRSSEYVKYVILLFPPFLGIFFFPNLQRLWFRNIS